MDAHWLLIFPPVDYSPPRNPFYEIGYAAARLRSLGMRTTFLDLNLAFFEHCLDPARVDRAIASRGGSNGSNGGPPPGELDRARSRLPDNLDLVRGRAGRTPSSEAFFRAMEDLELVLQCHASQGRGESVGLDHYLPGFSLPETSRLLGALAGDTDSVMRRFLEAHFEEEPPPDGAEMVVIWINNYFQLYGGLLAGAELRRIMPGSKICVVSNLLGRNTDALVRYPELATYLDALVGWEPEAALPDALSWARGELSAGRFPNGGVFESGRFVPSTRTVLTDLDELETPLFPDLGERRYFYPFPFLEIIGSRGCAFRRCVFCDDVGFGGYNKSPHRTRSARLVVEDIERLTREHGCRAFSFWDSNLTAAFLDALCTADRGGLADVVWSGHTRAETAADPERCASLSRAGCRLLNIGFESASQRLLDLMGKGQQVETMATTLASCRDAGIAVHGSFIQGFPTETEDELRDTAEFIEANLDLLDSFHVYDFQVARCSTMARSPEDFDIEIVPRAEGDIDVISRHRSHGRPPRTHGPLLDAVRARHPGMTLDHVLYDIHCSACSPAAAAAAQAEEKATAE